jgi:hypothetical protein
MPHIYIGHWEWHDDYISTPAGGEMLHNQDPPGDPIWRAPGGGIYTSMNLRSSGQSAQKGGTPQGLGIFVYEQRPSASPLLLVEVGQDPQRQLIKAEISTIETGLGLPPGSILETRFDRLLKEILIVHVDPTGKARCRPMNAAPSTGFRVRLQGVHVASGGRGIPIASGQNQDLISEKFSRSHPAWNAVIARYRAEYAELRDQMALGRLTLDQIRKVTGHKMRLLGTTDPSELLPAQYQGDGWLPPETSIADSFNRANNDDPSAGTGALSWEELEGSDWDIESNQMVNRQGIPSGTRVTCRANNDLSSGIHLATIDVPAINDTREAGPCIRFSSSEVTCYAGVISERDQAAAIYEIAAGTRTQRASQPATISISTTYTVSLEMDGSDLVSLDWGTGSISFTDASPISSSNVRTGLHARNTHATNEYDNFSAQDTGAGFAYTQAVIIG